MSGEKREEYSASEKEEEGEEEDIEEKDHEILKSRISEHPLYDLLVQQHLNCLEVGDISNLEKVDKEKVGWMKKAMKKQNLGMFSHSELDHFMEAYCMALGKLKEAMEEPQRESLAFINHMHSQLRDLTGLTLSPSPPSSSSSPHSNFQTRP